MYGELAMTNGHTMLARSRARSSTRCSAPAGCGELDYARRLRRSMHAGIIVLADRNFGAAALIGQLAATKAHLLVRFKGNRKLPVNAGDADLADGYGPARVAPEVAATQVRRRRCAAAPRLDRITAVTSAVHP
jgi:hypothetical protein